MDLDHERRQSPVERLSVELVRMILSTVPDVESLRAAVLSCPLFYHGFREAEASITALVLRRQIDDSVLPEAMAAAAAAQLRPQGVQLDNRDAADAFVNQWLRRRPTPPRSWLMRDALPIGRLHIHVDRWAVKLATEALRHPLKPQESQEFSGAATHQEMCRIERALYRFEIYCNLFRGVPTKPTITAFTCTTPVTILDEQKEHFFSNFARWENEQLGCIYDFLTRAVSPSVDDVAEHDVTWGIGHVPYDVGVCGSAPVEHVLSWGLARLHPIAEAEAYEERYRLLDADRMPEAVYSFLYEGLQDAANEHRGNVFFDDVQPGEEDRYFQAPFYADPDTGPVDVWRYMHEEEGWESRVYHEDRGRLRQWGYVLWDRARLEAAGIFQTPREELIRSQEEAILEEQESQRHRGYMQNSWEQRRSVSRDGGRGWWSWGDLSRLRWRVEEKKLRASDFGFHTRGTIKPTSLDDARNMLQAMKLPPSDR